MNIGNNLFQARKEEQENKEIIDLNKNKKS